MGRGIDLTRLQHRAHYQAQYAQGSIQVPDMESGAGAEGRGIAGLGQGVSRLGQAVAEMAKREQKAELDAVWSLADAESFAEMQRIQAEMQGLSTSDAPNVKPTYVTDPHDSGKMVEQVSQGLAKIRSKQEEHLPGKIKTEFLARFDKQASGITAQAGALRGKLLNDRYRADLQSSLDATVNALTPATTQGQFEDAITAGVEAVNRAVGLGKISAQEGQTYLESQTDGVRIIQAKNLIRENPAQAVAALNDPEQLTGLSAKNRQTLAGHASALLEKSRREAAQAREDKARSLWASHKDALASIYEHGDEGDGDLEKSLRALGDHDRADQWARERDLAYKTHNLLTSMDGMPLEDQERRIREAFAFQPGETGAAAKASARERALDAVQSREREKQAALRQVDHVRRQWAKDPAAMAIKDVRKNLPENATPYAEAQASMAKQREVLKGTGIQPRVLSNEVSKQFADSYEAADGRNRLGMLTELRHEYKDLYPNVADDLGLGVETDMALDALDSGGAQAFADAEMLVAQVKESELGADKDLAKDVRSAAQDVWKTDPVFQAAWGLAQTMPSSRYHFRYASEVFKTYQNLALRMGDAAKAKAVFDRIYGAVADPDIGYVTWPRSQAPDADAVAGGLESLRRSADVAKNTPENIRWVRAYGTWVNNGDRFSLLDPRSGELCRTPAGDIYAVSLGDVLRAGKEARGRQTAKFMEGTTEPPPAGALWPQSFGKPDANTPTVGEEDNGVRIGRKAIAVETEEDLPQ